MGKGGGVGKGCMCKPNLKPCLVCTIPDSLLLFGSGGGLGVRKAFKAIQILL